MAFDFNPVRDKAIDTLTSLGRKAQAQLLRIVDGAPVDPSKPWRAAAGTTLTFNFIGSFITLEPGALHSDPTLDGDMSAILPGTIIDAKAVEDGVTVCGAPTLNDFVQTQGSRYAIIGVKDITPDDLPIIFKLRCKSWPSITPQQ